MFSPLICFGFASSSLSDFVESHLHWLGYPLPILLVCGLLLGVASLLPRRSLRRLFRRSTLTLVLIYLVGYLPFTVTVAEAVLKKAVPHDTGAPVDAVVILGRGSILNPSRAEVAAQLWQEKRAPLIFASGISDSPRLLAMLRDKGIPDEALAGEGRSRTTYENAQFTADLLRPRGVRRIVLVTDGSHMLRSLLTFRAFGFEVTPAFSADPEHLDRRGRTKLVLREYLGLVGYGLMGRYKHHDFRAMLPVSDSPLVIGSQVKPTEKS